MLKSASAINFRLGYSAGSEKTIGKCLYLFTFFHRNLQYVVPDQLVLIYDMCRFDKALNFGKLSPWCAAFSPEDLLIFEYNEDMKSYYKNGYGYEINADQACNPVVDLFNYFKLLFLLLIVVDYFTHLENVNY